MLHPIKICGIWMPGQQLELFVLYLTPTLRCFCDSTYSWTLSCWVRLLPVLGGVGSACSGTNKSNIHINTKIQWFKKVSGKIISVTNFTCQWFNILPTVVFTAVEVYINYAV